MTVMLSDLPGYVHDNQMLTSDIILKALKQMDARREYTTEDFPRLRNLIVSGLNLCTISNLSDFALLTKLDISNNIIERLSGLDLLVSLETLNASFNMIQSLEGVERLTHLTDLIVNNNRIKNVAPLYQMQTIYRSLTGVQNSSHPLQQLNLQNNKIDDLINTIEALRGFKNLKIAIFQNNPISGQAVYRPQIIASLQQITYLDFIVVLKKERDKAYEQFATEINHHRDIDAAENNKMGKQLQKTRQIRIDTVSDCLNFNNIVQQELIDNESNQKLFLIPALRQEGIQNFQVACQRIFDNFARSMRRRRVMRQGEISEFEEFYDIVVADLQGSFENLVYEYYTQKSEIMKEFADIMAIKQEVKKDEVQVQYEEEAPEDVEEKEALEMHEERAEEELFEHEDQAEVVNLEVEDLAPRQDPAPQGEQRHRPQIKPLIAKPKQQQLQLTMAVEDERIPKLMLLRQKLLESLSSKKSKILVQEAETQNDIQDGIEKLQTILQQMQNKTVEVGQSYIIQIKEQINKFKDIAITMVVKAVEKKSKKDQEQNEPEKVAQEIIAGEQELQSQGQASVQQQQQVMQAEIQNLLPAEMTPQVIALLKDATVATGAVTQAHEYKITVVETKEDALTASQKEFVDQVMKVINGAETERVRCRVIEINEWEAKEKEFIEKLVIE